MARQIQYLVFINIVVKMNFASQKLKKCRFLERAGGRRAVEPVKMRHIFAAHGVIRSGNSAYIKKSPETGDGSCFTQRAEILLLCG